MLIRLVAIIAVFLIGASPALPGDGPLPISSDTKALVVNKVADLMTEHYVVQATGKAMGDHIRSRLSDGAYDSFGDTIPFCRQVTIDLREISHDKHLFVFHSLSEARAVAAGNGLLSPEDTSAIKHELYASELESNFGFVGAEVLDGNVGYLRLDAFSGEDDATKRADAAMAFLATTQAVIIDLRSNGGGGGPVLSHLATYFFEGQPVRLTGVWYRATGETEEVWTLPVVSGRRIPDVGLYILTSARTFSAAEDFAYSLQALDRAVIIGEATKGGAHPIDVFIVEGNILTQIAIGNSINPITGSNWEGAGVQPDVAVPADQALETALKLAREN
jgi:hypothetical protein